MNTSAYIINTWSNRILKARINHPCDRCGETIIAGTRYERNVNRFEKAGGQGPRFNTHFHLDCTAPWEREVKHLRHAALGRLRKNPLPHQTRPTKSYLKYSIDHSNEQTGTLMWKPPPALAAKLAAVRSSNTAEAAMAEIESSLHIVLIALMQSVGDRRHGIKVSELISDIAATIVPPPVPKAKKTKAKLKIAESE